MYWHHIVNLKEDSLLKKVYKAQKNQPVKGDWVKTLEDDKAAFQIELNDDDLKSISKNSFKMIVKKKANECAFKYLQALKNNHSKMNNIKFKQINFSK